MVGAGARDTPRHDLAAIGHEPGEPALVAEADLLHAIHAELAYLPAYTFFGTRHADSSRLSRGPATAAQPPRHPSSMSPASRTERCRRPFRRWSPGNPPRRQHRRLP